MTFDPRDPRPEDALPPEDILPLEEAYPPEEELPPGGLEELLRPPDPIARAALRRIAEYGRPTGLEAQAAFPDAALEDEELAPEAGIAVGGAVLLAIVFVIVFGASGTKGTNVKIDNSADVVSLTPLAHGLNLSIISAASVRSGPGLDYDAIGEVTRGQDVEAAGRNVDSSWFAIYYPPNSEYQGWLPATALKLPSNASSLLPVVAVTPIPRPTPIIPTLAPEPTEALTATPTVGTSPTVAAGADIAAGIAQGSCSLSTPIAIVVRNAGASRIEGRTVRITIVEGSATAQLPDIGLSPLDPGQSITLPTGYVPRSSHVIVSVNLVGQPADINPGNNQADCVISVQQPAPSPAPPGPATVVPPPPIGTHTP